LTNEKPVGDVGRYAGWGSVDDDSAPFQGEGRKPVQYPDNLPDDLWRHKLFWFLYPSLLLALGIWWVLKQWLHLPEWTGWISVAVASAMCVAVGLRGPQLLLLGSRMLGRQSNLR
jgi:hypothetical protein